VARITQETMVNEVLALGQPAWEVLNRYGLDTCCGGNETLQEQAGRLGLDLEQLIKELNAM
jgi:regulator of cell morphogenesis and NO signaling